MAGMWKRCVSLFAVWRRPGYDYSLELSKAANGAVRSVNVGKCLA